MKYDWNKQKGVKMLDNLKGTITEEKERLKGLKEWYRAKEQYREVLRIDRELQFIEWLEDEAQSFEHVEKHRQKNRRLKYGL